MLFLFIPHFFKVYFKKSIVFFVNIEILIMIKNTHLSLLFIHITYFCIQNNDKPNKLKQWLFYDFMRLKNL